MEKLANAAAAFFYSRLGRAIIVAAGFFLTVSYSIKIANGNREIFNFAQVAFGATTVVYNLGKIFPRLFSPKITDFLGWMVIMTMFVVAAAVAAIVISH